MPLLRAEGGNLNLVGRAVLNVLRLSVGSNRRGGGVGGGGECWPGQRVSSQESSGGRGTGTRGGAAVVEERAIRVASRSWGHV